MAFFAGSVYAQAVMDDSQFTKKTQDMTGSVLKANIAFAALQKGVQVVTDVIKKGIESFKAQEAVDAQLNATLKSTNFAVGLTAKEIKNLAGELQNTTTFGDDMIQTGQNLLLTFTNIGKDVFPDATKTMLDMSQALGQDVKSSAMQLGKALNDPIRGITALRRVGVNFTQAQEDMIKGMVEAGDTLGAQKLILKELQTEFGGSATAARDTFGGAMKALENQQGELMESVGGVAAVIGRELVEELIKGAKAFQDFITSGQGLDAIANGAAFFGASLKILSEIVNQRLKDAFDYISRIVKPIAERFTNLKNSSGETNVIFTALAGASKLMSIGLGVMSKLIALVVNNFLNLGEAINENIKFAAMFFDGMTGKKKWSEVSKQAVEAFDSLKTIGSDLVTGVANLVTETIDEFKKMPEEIKVSAQNMQQNFSVTFDTIKNKTKEVLTGVSDEIKDTKLEPEPTAAEKWKKFWEEVLKKGKEAAAKIGEVVGKIKEGFDKVASAISSTFSGVQETVKMSLDNELTALQNQKERALNEIETAQANELAANQKGYQAQLEALQASFDSGKITEEQYGEQKKALEEKNAADTEAITAKHNAKMATENENFRRKEYEQKKKAFETEKAFRIAQIWINLATAVMGFWAAYASIPFAGPAIAGALTGVATGIAIAQTVLVATQEFPEFADGGTVGGGTPVRMNEKGGEIAKLPDGTIIVPNDISRQIAGAAGGGNVINVSFSGAKIADDMSLQKITNHVVREIGRQLRTN